MNLLSRPRYIQVGLIIAFAGGVLLLVPQVFNGGILKNRLPLPLPLTVSATSRKVTEEHTSGTEAKHMQGFTELALHQDGHVARANRPKLTTSEYVQKSAPRKTTQKSHSNLSTSMQSRRQKQEFFPSFRLHGTLQKEQKSICTKMETLPQPVMAKIKSYLYFIGHARSGHSIVGSILDSHPHIVVSHEFDAFKKLSEGDKSCNSKRRLFNALWENSCTSITDGLRTDEAVKKGYTLAIDNLYQGAYQSYIDVIGDKKGGSTVVMYKKDHDEFESILYKLRSIISLPMKVIHVIRNPYDNIATIVFYHTERQEHVKVTKLKEGDHEQSINPGVVDRSIAGYFSTYQAIEEIKVKYKLDVLEVHGKDLISNPKKTLVTMCDFLHVSCPDDFLTVCADKIFPKESKTRYKLKWNDDQISAVKMNIKKYPNLYRYLEFDS